MKKRPLKSILGLIAILALFVIFSYLVSKNKGTIESFIVNDFYGMMIYLFIMILETVIAPTSFFPLVAIASNLWGWVVTGFLNWLGWVTGSLIIFWIVRKYGICLIQRIIPIDKIAEAESYVPEEHKFVSLIIWRMFIPADLLSYALSFLTNIRFRTYFWTAVIGIAPFSFIIAYLGVLPIMYQIVGIIFGLIILGIGFFISYKKPGRKLRAERLKKQLREDVQRECKV
ncbi:MAG: VTT domain-containing protein [archaeon]